MELRILSLAGEYLGKLVVSSLSLGFPSRFSFLSSLPHALAGAVLLSADDACLLSRGEQLTPVELWQLVVDGQLRQLVGGLLHPLLVGETLTPESQESLRRRSMAAAGLATRLSSLYIMTVGCPTDSRLSVSTSLSSSGLVERTESVESIILSWVFVEADVPLEKISLNVVGVLSRTGFSNVAAVSSLIFNGVGLSIESLCLIFSWDAT